MFQEFSKWSKGRDNKGNQLRRKFHIVIIIMNLQSKYSDVNFNTTSSPGSFPIRPYRRVGKDPGNEIDFQYNLLVEIG